MHTGSLLRPPLEMTHLASGGSPPVPARQAYHMEPGSQEQAGEGRFALLAEPPAGVDSVEEARASEPLFTRGPHTLRAPPWVSHKGFDLCRRPSSGATPSVLPSELTILVPGCQVGQGTWEAVRPFAHADLLVLLDHHALPPLWSNL